MVMKKRQCGSIEIQAVEEWSGLYRDPLEMYPDATPEIVARHRDWLVPEAMDAETGRMLFAFQSYLLRTGRTTILIDTCVGEDKDRPGRPDWHRKKWPWLDNLKAAGIAPEEVDFVMCTHLHVDHVGWNTKLEDGRWVPTFPNASYLFGEIEYRHWEAEYKNLDFMREVFADSVLPIMEAGKATLIGADYEIDTGLTIEPSPGHTPGHISLNVNSGGQHAVFSGDLMHHPLQVPEPQLSSMFCSDAEQSRRTRTAFVERYADSDTVILPAHFPGRSAGRIKDHGGITRFDFCDD